MRTVVVPHQAATSNQDGVLFVNRLPEPGNDYTYYNPCSLARTGFCSSELDTADLVTTGHLSDDAMSAVAGRLQFSWIRNRRTYFNKDNVAELRCAAALAATGHLTSVKYLIYWKTWSCLTVRT